MIKWAQSNPVIFTALVSFFSAVFGGCFTVLIWPAAKVAVSNLWTRLHNRRSGKTFENEYLSWVIKSHQYLPILPTTLIPITAGNLQELDRIYISLTIGSSRDDPHDISVADAVKANHRLVILGEPGAGKTTMLRFLALTFARGKSGNVITGISASPSLDSERVRFARSRIRADFGYEEFPFPIFVYLNRLHDVVKWPADGRLLQYIVNEWNVVSGARSLPPDYLEKKLNRGECIFLFDAFDELGARHRSGIDCPKGWGAR